MSKIAFGGDNGGWKENAKSRKGKTYGQIHGEEKANLIKAKKKISSKGKGGRIWTQEEKDNHSKIIKDKHENDFDYHEKCIDNNPMQGKTGEKHQNYGKNIHSDKFKQEQRDRRQGKLMKKFMVLNKVKNKEMQHQKGMLKKVILFGNQLIKNMFYNV